MELLKTSDKEKTSQNIVEKMLSATFEITLTGDRGLVNFLLSKKKLFSHKNILKDILNQKKFCLLTKIEYEGFVSADYRSPFMAIDFEESELTNQYGDSEIVVKDSQKNNYVYVVVCQPNGQEIGVEGVVMKILPENMQLKRGHNMIYVAELDAEKFVAAMNDKSQRFFEKI